MNEEGEFVVAAAAANQPAGPPPLSIHSKGTVVGATTPSRGPETVVQMDGCVGVDVGGAPDAVSIRVASAFYNVEKEEADPLVLRCVGITFRHRGHRGADITAATLASSSSRPSSAPSSALASYAASTTASQTTQPSASGDAGDGTGACAGFVLRDGGKCIFAGCRFFSESGSAITVTMTSAREKPTTAAAGGMQANPTRCARGEREVPPPSSMFGSTATGKACRMSLLARDCTFWASSDSAALDFSGSGVSSDEDATAPTGSILLSDCLVDATTSTSAVAVLIRKRAAPLLQRVVVRMDPAVVRTAVCVQDASPYLFRCSFGPGSGTAVVVRGTQSTPTLTECIFQGCEQSGLFVTDRASPIVSRCRFVRCGKAAVFIKSGSAPDVLDCVLERSDQTGVYVLDGGAGLLARNDITGGRKVGVLCTTNAAPILRNNLIRNHGREGVWVCQGGGGAFFANDLRGNFSGAKDVSDVATFKATFSEADARADGLVEAMQNVWTQQLRKGPNNKRPSASRKTSARGGNMSGGVVLTTVDPNGPTMDKAQLAGPSQPDAWVKNGSVANDAQFALPLIWSSDNREC